MTVHTPKMTVHDFYVLYGVFCVMIANGNVKIECEKYLSDFCFLERYY